MYLRRVILVIIYGALLGIMLYCWQVSLANFNDAVKPEKPLQLWSVKRSLNKLEVEILGTKWLIRLPGVL